MDSDPAAVWGVVGTWVAVILALIALIGIVSPWLILRAALSDRNKVLNSVQDYHQDYVTKGFGIGRKIRFFRKTNVPELAPNYDYREGVQSLTIPQTNRLWSFNRVKGTTCRIGWAKFCRLLECYTVDVPNTVSVLATVPDGALKIQGELTWLPVSRFWILAVGILGRYHYGLALNTLNFRRDLDGYRIEETTFERNYGSDDDHNSSGDDGEKGSSIYDSSGDDVPGKHDPGQRTLARKDAKVGRLRGHTGSFRLLPTQQSQPPSALYFQPQTSTNIGLDHKREFLTLTSMLWLATGFIPLANSKAGVEEVACLEDPSTSMAKSLPKYGDYFLALRVAQDRPRFLSHIMESFGIENVTVLTLQLVHQRDSTLGIDEDAEAENWVRRSTRSSCYLSRLDIERVAYAMLRLPWTTWSYLTWKDNNAFWNDILHEVSGLVFYFTRYPPLAHRMSTYDTLKDSLRIARRTLDQVMELSDHVASLVTISEEARLTIALLVMTNHRFRKQIEAFCANFRLDDIVGHSEGPTPSSISFTYNRVSDHAADGDRRSRSESTTRSSTSKTNTSSVDSQRRKPRRKATKPDVKATNSHDENSTKSNGDEDQPNGRDTPPEKIPLPPSIPDSDPDPVNIPSFDTTSEPEEDSVALTIDMASRTVTWTIPGSPEGVNPVSFRFKLLPSEQCVNMSIIEVKRSDLIACLCWVSLRCLMWRASPNSKPLLTFVKRLNRVAYIM